MKCFYLLFFSAGAGWRCVWRLQERDVYAYSSCWAQAVRQEVLLLLDSQRTSGTYMRSHCTISREIW